MKIQYVLFYVFALLLIIPADVVAQGENYPNLKASGRIHYDLTLIDQGEERFAGQEFRRMMLSAKGQVSERVGYKVHFDFAAGKVGFRDIYLKLGELPFIKGHLLIGNFAEPTGIDMLTSSNYISFIERAMLTSTQNFRWNSGFQYANHSLLNKRAGLQLAYTFNGDRNSAFLDNRVLEGRNFVGRIYATPYIKADKNHLVHVAFNYEYRDNPDDEYKLSFRPETHFWNKVEYTHPADIQNDFGLELAATFGSLSFQGEYEVSTHDIGGERFNVTGYYGYASFFLTGEFRPYKNGVFSRVKPKNEFDALENKWGAIELLARYSVMDFENAIIPATYVGESIGNVTSCTAGLNWHLNKHTRMMYNFIWSDLSVEENYTAHMFRAQIDF